MPDMDDMKNEAESQGVDKAEQFADKEAGGKDQGLIDKAGDEAEKALGENQQQ